jgi:hypothetical protein
VAAALLQQVQEFLDVFGGQTLLNLYPRARQHIGDLFEKRNRYHHLEPAGHPGIPEAGGVSMGIDKGRNPNIRVKQDDGHRAVPWLCEQPT